MPVLPSSAYGTAEGVLNAARALVGDARIAAGDVLTDSAPIAFRYLNTAYHHVQFELAVNGIETFIKEAILLNVPAVATEDASVQVVINDTGTNNGTQSFQSPQLPTDLLVPLRLWERQNGSSESFIPMNQPKDGLRSALQTNRLMVWEWRYDGIYLVGSLQANDLRLRYEAVLNDLVATTDPVLIRGAQNVLAFLVAEQFSTARGSPVAASFGQAAQRALEQMFLRASRRQQRTPHRRRPYSWRRRIGGGLPY
jgi:hypothetical protein